MDQEGESCQRRERETANQKWHQAEASEAETEKIIEYKKMIEERFCYHIGRIYLLGQKTRSSAVVPSKREDPQASKERNETPNCSERKKETKNCNKIHKGLFLFSNIFQDFN